MLSLIMRPTIVVLAVWWLPGALTGLFGYCTLRTSGLRCHTLALGQRTPFLGRRIPLCSSLVDPRGLLRLMQLLDENWQLPLCPGDLCHRFV